MQANNPGADPLRAILMRDAAPRPAAPPPYAQAAAAPPPAAAPPQYAAGPASGYAPLIRPSAAPVSLAPAPVAPVQSQPLPPLPR